MNAEQEDFRCLRALATTNIYLPKKAPLALDLRARISQMDYQIDDLLG